MQKSCPELRVSLSQIELSSITREKVTPGTGQSRAVRDVVLDGGTHGRV